MSGDLIYTDWGIDAGTQSKSAALDLDTASVRYQRTSGSAALRSADWSDGVDRSRGRPSPISRHTRDVDSIVRGEIRHATNSGADGAGEFEY